MPDVKVAVSDQFLEAFSQVPKKQAEEGASVHDEVSAGPDPSGNQL